MKTALAVISPHRDDAALSLGGFLGRLARTRLPFRIVNCFTTSAWAPCRDGLSVEQTTRVRRREDRCFARRLAYVPSWTDLRGLDAPLRLGAGVEICGYADEAPPHDVEWLVRQLRTIDAHVVVAPLAIGRHVDHLVARDAVARRGGALAFYEDFPYAGIASEHEAAASVDDAGARAGRTLRPLAIRGGVAEKLSIARIYRSQIGDEERRELASAARRIGGERIWADEAALPQLERWLERSSR